MFQIASSAVNGRPDRHFASGWMVSVQVFRSSLASHFSSNSGWVTLFWSVRVRYWTVLRSTLLGSTQEMVCGSLTSCTRMPMRILPPFGSSDCACAGAGRPAIA